MTGYRTDWPSIAASLAGIAAGATITFWINADRGLFVCMASGLCLGWTLRRGK